MLERVCTNDLYVFVLLFLVMVEHFICCFNNYYVEDFNVIYMRRTHSFCYKYVLGCTLLSSVVGEAVNTNGSQERLFSCSIICYGEHFIGVLNIQYYFCVVMA